MTWSQTPARSTGQPGRFRMGFSSLDIALVVGVVGSLAWFGLGGTIEDAGRTEVKQAADFLMDIHRCQTEYQDQNGHFADRLDELDLRFPTPVLFDVYPLVMDENGWTAIAIEVGPGASENPTRLEIDQDGWVNHQPTHTGTPKTTFSGMAFLNTPEQSR